MSEKIGKYTLVRHLATGGMAEIWLAEQRGPGGFNKELVIKKILPHLADEGDMTQMFFDEARIVAHLTHPNIGQVFELGEHDGDYFIAMEFIDGFDLQELREEVKARGRSIPAAYAARIVCDVLKALDYAHNYVDRDGNHVGLVHRDISPHNVLISKEGVVKLVDFGVAKAAMNTHKTETGAVKGKFAYMAPEQIEDRQLDHRVDIFAVGVLFYELLTGIKPFGDELQAVSRIVNEDAADPRTHRPEIPDALASTIMRALQRDRRQRFSTAAEMERALERYLQGTPHVVGNRELSVMVRQLRGMDPQKPTEQLFGFEKQGVERDEPRMTVPNGQGSTTGPTTPTPSTPTSSTPDSGPSPAPPSSTPAPMVEEPNAARSPSGCMVAAYTAVMMSMIAGFGVASHAVISGAEPSSVQAGEPGDDQPWRHGEDARIVSIDIADEDESAEVFYDSDRVGQTPFYTYLRPGSYDVELAVDDNTSEVEVVVEEDPEIQSFRFEL